MSRFFVFGVIFQFLCSYAYCGVLFEEDFSGQVEFDDTSKAEIVQGSLDFKFQREQGNRVYIQDYDAGVRYKLGTDLTEDKVGKTLYLGFSLRSLSDTVKDKFAGLVLYDEGKEVFGLGNDYSSGYFSFWASNGKGVPIGEVPVRVDNQVHKIVMRIDYNPDGAEDIKIWLDPFCRRSESRQLEDIRTEYEYELDFDEIRLRCGNEGSNWEFDEIRIGTDWTDVTPPNEEPGAYISELTADASQPGKTEKIADGIIRFLPAGTDSSPLPPSFVLAESRNPVGTVHAPFELTPQFGVSGQKRYVYIDTAPEVDFYGTGEVTGGLLRNGYKITLFNKDNYGYGKPDQLYQSHPWVLGLREDGSAFGVIFDTTWKARLDLRAGILFTVPAESQRFPVYIIDGDSPQQVMERLADLSGTMPMPPRWALGYQQCRYSYHPAGRVREIADTFRAKQIPCDVIWFDIDYMDGYRIFTFDSNEFPDPEGINDYLHSMGFKSVWMIDPGVKYEPGYFVYDSGTEADVWVKTASGEPFVGPVWPGDCVFPDFTSPAVRKWWAGLYEDFMAKGIDGVWNDMDEPAVFEEKYNWTMPLDNRHRGGGGLPAGPHIQYHNVYGMMMVKATRKGIKNANPEKRPFVLTRANFLGGHRYAATWTGDNKASWKHLKWSIPMSLNLSLSGQPFNGPDIGGFIGNATPQLWAHWISVGAFYPFCRAHSAKGTDNQEPWSFGEETETAARIALQRRYRLMPYLYTLFRQSHLEGLPVMRPVFFADSADVSLRMEDQAFLLGPDLMVIPKWADSVQLPDNIWRTVSILNNEPANNEYQCELRVRGGAIVPLGPVVQSTAQIRTRQRLTLIVVPDEQGQAEGILYEDTGDGYGYKEGDFCFSKFKARKQNGNIVVKCTSRKGNLVSEKRLVTVAVITSEGVRYGFGDVISGVKVILDNTSASRSDID